MSNTNFGIGSNSYGQFWFGGSTFPGFLYKRNLGVGGRRSTKMTPGGNITCNSPTYLYNKYKPGQGGVGASSMSNRRAKNRLATVCGPQQCFPCYTTLGQYSKYTHNPNGYIPCPVPLPPSCPYKISTGGTFTNNNDLERLRGSTTITGNVIIENFTQQPDFTVFDCLTTITGNLKIWNNAYLTNIVGFNALESVAYGLPFVPYQNYVLIQNNTILKNIQGFNLLKKINGLFAIYFNNALTSITGFDNLQTIVDYFNINLNAVLTAIPSFNNLATVGTFLIILDNSILPTISGFNALTGNSSGYLTIGPNKILPNTSICQSSKTKLENYFTGIHTFTNTDVNVSC